MPDPCRLWTGARTKVHLEAQEPHAVTLYMVPAFHIVGFYLSGDFLPESAFPANSNLDYIYQEFIPYVQVSIVFRISHLESAWHSNATALSAGQYHLRP